MKRTRPANGQVEALTARERERKDDELYRQGDAVFVLAADRVVERGAAEEVGGMDDAQSDAGGSVEWLRGWSAIRYYWERTYAGAIGARPDLRDARGGRAFDSAARGRGVGAFLFDGVPRQVREERAADGSERITGSKRRATERL